MDRVRVTLGMTPDPLSPEHLVLGWAASHLQSSFGLFSIFALEVFELILLSLFVQTFYHSGNCIHSL